MAIVTVGTTGMQVMAPAQVWQRLQGGFIPLGRALEADLRSDAKASQAVYAFATEAHERFWGDWASWRHAFAGAPGGSFHDIVGLFAMEEMLVTHMALAPTDLVVDLGCGPAWMARFMPHNGGRYLGIDVHRPTVELARTELERLGIHGDVIEHDLLRGLPEAVIEVMRSSPGARVLARWALYLPLDCIVQIARQAFDAGAQDFTIDQLTAGKFNPPLLMIHFMPFLVKGLASRKLSAEQVRRALGALPKMIPFGIALKRHFPIWSAEQISKALAGVGCSVEVLERPLWGQTTFMRATR